MSADRGVISGPFSDPVSVESELIDSDSEPSSRWVLRASKDASHVAHERSKKLPEPPVMFRGRREQASPPIPIRRRSRRPKGGGHAPQPVHGLGGGNHQESPSATSPPLRPGQQWKSYQAVGGEGEQPKAVQGPAAGLLPSRQGIPSPLHPHLTFGAQGRSSGPRYEARWRPQFPRRSRRSGTSFLGRTNTSVTVDGGREVLRAGPTPVR
ncbi:hypothetical protein NDU88_005635 [Pleurodeles waltl]|uniref:Uncharacterized protein n=1 Tax=Pleurodeles waltl TaxID=8319 RepID=A0AAV7PJ47_PLEWA|nr:hypothetical protein NDU88_005635 [Pleurodeles waltl]